MYNTVIYLNNSQLIQNYRKTIIWQIERKKQNMLGNITYNESLKFSESYNLTIMETEYNKFRIRQFLPSLLIL
ncbi:unnamed protein product [Paramecium sonneborni]|uniref:Uncharacterized protein n=1 Tax=Paramecium sonneborni TaxID=65129 RepID=A0A8S1QCV9_9CILI|nr:unnamed protein product [Paramecium sonneborni]